MRRILKEDKEVYTILNANGDTIGELAKDVNWNGKKEKLINDGKIYEVSLKETEKTLLYEVILVGEATPEEPETAPYDYTKVFEVDSVDIELKDLKIDSILEFENDNIDGFGLLVGRELLIPTKITLTHLTARVIPYYPETFSEVYTVKLTAVPEHCTLRDITSTSVKKSKKYEFKNVRIDDITCKVVSYFKEGALEVIKTVRMNDVIQSIFVIDLSGLKIVFEREEGKSNDIDDTVTLFKSLRHEIVYKIRKERTGKLAHIKFSSSSEFNIW